MKRLTSAVLLIVLVFSIATAEEKFKMKEIYKADAKADADIQNALIKAKENHQRVLLMFGANWCIWCQRLHHLFETNKTVNKYLHNNYQLVLVDLGKRDRNMDIDARYGNPNKQGLPALLVLDTDGKLLHTQETGALEFPKEHKEKGHDPEKVMAFLQEWSVKK